MKINQDINNIQGKIFIGYILDIEDPANLGRKAVYIPSLLKSPLVGEKYIFCKEAINTYVRARDPLKNDIPYFSYGTYQPLLPGTKVLVTFVTNSVNSGYIIGIDATVKEPPNKEWIVFKTPNNSEFYVNDNNGILHIKNANGFTNLYMTKDDIYLQVNDVDSENENDLKAQTYIQLSKDKIIFKVGDTTYSFGNNGIVLSTGKKAATFIEVTKDTININATKNININSEEGTIGINGQYTYVTGYNELHLYGTDARFTGAQKAQISGSTVVMWGWLDAHVKGMHVGIDAWISLETFTTVKNEINLALENVFSGVVTKSSSLESTTTGLKSENYSIKTQDGIVVSNLGMGSGISSTMTATGNTVALGLKSTLLTMNTAFLMNDPFMGAANQVLTMSIAGSANQSLGGVAPAGTGQTHLNNKNAVVAAIKLRHNHESNTKKYILPDKLSL